MTRAEIDQELRACEGICKHVARQYFLPGGDYDDLIQEARIGAYKGLLSFDGDRGAALRNHLFLCAERHVISAVKSATRNKHLALNQAISLDATVNYDDELTLADVIADDQASVEDTIDTGIELARLGRLVWTELTDLEHDVMIGIVSGKSYGELGDPKQVDNALQRGRRKLRASLTLLEAA